jgi:plastocyanin
MKPTKLVVGLALAASIVAIALGVLAVHPAGHTASAATLQPQRVTLVIVPDALKGSDKRTHDAYVPASFTASVGQQVIVTVYNLDTAPHSFTAPGLSLNVIVSGARDQGYVGIKTFSFTAKKAGTYRWKCILPCDNGGVNAWAMTHDGYMAGTVTIR